MTQDKIYVKTSKHKTKPIQIWHPSGRGESFQEFTIAEARELIQDLEKASGTIGGISFVSHDTTITELQNKLDAVTKIACQKNTRPRSAILRLGDLNRIRRILGCGSG